MRLTQLNLGAIGLGALAGLGTGLILFVVLAVAGLANTVVLIVVQFLMLLLAGYIAAIFAPTGAAVHGGLAGLAAFAIIGAISLAGAQGPGPAELVLLAVIAAILGSVGGALADRRR